LDTHAPTGISATEPAEDRSGQPAWTASAPPLASGFIPRPETGQALETALVPGSVIALVPDRTGTESRSWRDACGKTQLAVAAARSLWQSGAVELVIWLTATSRASVLSGYAEAARTAGAAHGMGTGMAGDADSLATRLISWLRETDRSWLVVFDDLTAGAVPDERLWPAGPAGRVLITTADPAALTGRGPSSSVQLVPIGPFSRREALNYLVGRLTMDLDQRQGAIDLTSELGHEPLALAQASAVIASSELTCHGYREHFAARRDQAITAAGGREPAASAITWGLSIDHADLMSPGAAQPLLVLAALLDGNGIPGAIFATEAAREYCTDPVVGSGAQKIKDDLALLESAGLLIADQESAAPMIRMSWPVQAAVRAAMPDAMLKGAAAAAANAVLEAWPTENAENGENAGNAVNAEERLARDLRSCAESLRQAAGQLLWESGCHPVLLRAGRSLDAAALTGPAVAYWEELAATSARALGRDHPATSGINERLARAYLAARQAANAIALLQAIRQERAERLGPDHPGTLEITRGLGQALISTGRFDEAVAILAQATENWARSHDANSIGGMNAREDLAAAHRAAGELAPAIALYRGAVAERERLQGPRHADTTAARHKLAEAYLADGQAKAAISQYERVVSDRERALGPGHLLTIGARGALGAACHSAGRMASAVRLAERTRTEYVKVLGPDHPDTLAACVNLAHAYYGVGRITDAERLLQQTVERCELNLPASDSLTVAARVSLANINGTGSWGSPK
jgi:tetratricopeptide (TPR) repeat protein